jgi:hypothetical protein
MQARRSLGSEQGIRDIGGQRSSPRTPRLEGRCREGPGGGIGVVRVQDAMKGGRCAPKPAKPAIRAASKSIKFDQKQTTSIKIDPIRSKSIKFDQNQSIKSDQNRSNSIKFDQLRSKMIKIEQI